MFANAFVMAAASAEVDVSRDVLVEDFDDAHDAVGRGSAPNDGVLSPHQAVAIGWIPVQLGCAQRAEAGVIEACGMFGGGVVHVM